MHRKAEQIRLKVLGPFAIEHNAHTSSLRRKTRALLSYLAITQIPQPRRRLLTWFCANSKDPARNLNLLLSRIRRLHSDILLREQDRVQINLAIVQADLYQFEEGVRPDSSTAAIENAIALYRGGLLDGLTLPDASEFELWLLGERSRVRHLYENGLSRLADHYIGCQMYAQALPILQTLVQSSPLREDAHARLIRLYEHSRQFDAARQQYERCAQLLADELAVEPSKALQTLYAQLGSGSLERSPIAPAAVDTIYLSHDRSPFVGRSAELDQLRLLWQSGQPQTVWIEAEAGGGKSRLVTEWLDQQAANPETILTGVCYDTTRHMPLQPWLELLETRFERLDSSLAESLPISWRRQLAVLLPALSAEPAKIYQQPQLFQAVVAALLRLGPPPRVLLIEDLQWADADSLALLQFVVQQVQRRRLPTLVIVTSRPEELAQPALLQTLKRSGNLTRLVLPLLTRAELATLVEQIAAPDNSLNRLAQNLYRATGGNPLFATEIIRELQASSKPPTELPVPPSLQLLTESRLQQLPASSKQVLEALAILDQPARFDLAQQVSARSEDETIDALEQGLRWRFLQIDERQYLFSHGLMRDALMHQLSFVRRERLHRRAATALETAGASAAILTWHWGEAGDIGKQTHFALQAGDDSAEIYATSQAIHFYQIAVDGIGLEQDTAQRKLANWLILAGQWERAESIYKMVLHKGGVEKSIGQEAEGHLGLGRIAILRGLYDEAEPHLTAALERYETTEDIVGILATISRLGTLTYWRGRYDEAQNYFEWSLKLGKQLDDQEKISDAHNGLGLLRQSAGKLDAAHEQFFAMLSVTKESGNLSQQSRALGSIAIVYAQKAELITAADYWFKTLDIARDIGAANTVQTTLGNLGHVYALFGDLEPASRCLIEQFTLCLELGTWPNIVIGVTNLANTLRQMAQYALAQEVLLLMVGLAEKIGIAAPRCFTELIIAYCYRDQGDVPQAIHWATVATNRSLAEKQWPIEYHGKLLLAQLYYQQTQDTAAALAAFEPLLEKWKSAEHRARLLAAIYEIDPTQTAARDEGAKLLRTVYAQSNLAEFRTLYQQLTDETLPPPPKLPSLPTSDKSLAQLPQLLGKVRAFVDGVTLV